DNRRGTAGGKAQIGPRADTMAPARHDLARADLEYRRAEGPAVAARDVLLGQPDHERHLGLIVAEGSPRGGRLADPRRQVDDETSAIGGHRRGGSRARPPGTASALRA